MTDKFDELLLVILSVLTVLSILVSILCIIGMFWYALYGNPAADIGHFVKEVRKAMQ